MTAFAIEKLARRHPVESFDCGQPVLNRFLARFALASQQANASQTYLGLADGEIVGFYTLVVSEVAYTDAPERLTKGLARHPVPLMLLARLAVSVAWQGRSVGAGLLKDAMRRTLQVAEMVGIRALAAHAKLVSLLEQSRATRERDLALTMFNNTAVLGAAILQSLETGKPLRN